MVDNPDKQHTRRYSTFFRHKVNEEKFIDMFEIRRQRKKERYEGQKDKFKVLFDHKKFDHGIRKSLKMSAKLSKNTRSYFDFVSIYEILLKHFILTFVGWTLKGGRKTAGNRTI